MQVNKQQEKMIYAATRGYKKYYKKIYKRKPSLDILLDYFQHRENLLNRICSKKALNQEYLQSLMKANGFSYEEQDGKISKIHRIASFDFNEEWADRLGGSSFYGGVYVDFDDVFAIVMHRSKDTEGNAICAFFTNDPYVPVFTVRIINIDKEMKNSDLCIVLTDKFFSLCPNITYPVCGSNKLKKMIKKDSMQVKGQQNVQFLFAQLEKLEFNWELYSNFDLEYSEKYPDDKSFIKECNGYVSNVEEMKKLILSQSGTPMHNENLNGEGKSQEMAPVFPSFKDQYEEWVENEKAKRELARQKREEKNYMETKGKILRKCILVILVILLGLFAGRSCLNFFKTVDFFGEPNENIFGSFFLLSSIMIAVWVFVSEHLSKCEDEMFIWKFVKVIGLESCIAIAGFTVMAEDGSGLISNSIRDTFSDLGGYVRFLNSFFSTRPIIGFSIKVLTVLAFVGIWLIGIKEFVLSYISLVAKFIAVVVGGYILLFIADVFFGKKNEYVVLGGWYIVFTVLSCISFLIIYYILKSAPTNQQDVDELFNEEYYEEEEEVTFKEKIKLFFSKDYWNYAENKKLYLWFAIGSILYVISVVTGKISNWNNILLSVLEQDYISVNDSVNVSDSYGAIYYFYSTFVAMVMGAVISIGKNKRKNRFLFSINCLLFTFLAQVWGMTWCVDKLMEYYQVGIIDSSVILSSIMNAIGEFISGLSDNGILGFLLFIAIAILGLALIVICGLATVALFSVGSCYLLFYMLINVLVYKLVGLVMPNIPFIVIWLLTWGINSVAQYYISFVEKEFFRHNFD